ncbi:MAG TPA: MXAN_5187 family protein [Anaeromyxobacteraceae bacterium]
MARLKLWGFALLALAAGAACLFLETRWLAGEALAAADRDLRAAGAQLDARSLLLAAQATAVAEAAARQPAVLAALADHGEGDATAAAAVAVAAAARGMPAEAARALLVGTAGREGAAVRVGGKDAEVQDPAGGLFAEALRGRRREGYARVAGRLFFVSAVPAGKGSVAVGLPVDDAWARALRAAAGAEVTLLAGQGKPVTTLERGELAAVTAAAESPTPRPVDAGALSRLRTAIPAAPALPLLLARAPAHRVQVVALRGTRTGLAALSVAMGPRLAGLATFQWTFVLALVLLGLAGLFVGFLGGELPMGVPHELLATAERIQRGDFGARVAPLAGSLGTVAKALNRAAEAAEAGKVQVEQAGAAAVPPPTPTPVPVPEPDPFARFGAPTPAAPTPRPAADPPPPMHAAAEPEVSAPDLFAASRTPPPPAPRPPAGQAGPGDAVSDATSLATRPEELAGVAPTPAGGVIEPPHPAATPTALFPPASRRSAPTPPQVAGGWPAPAAPAAPRPFSPTATADTAAWPAPAAPPAARTPPPPGLDPDEAHWQEVFREFVRLRVACGEGAEGLTFERFVGKLRQNREQLLRKYECRAVRFEAYVKDGRAALKAQPIR